MTTVTLSTAKEHLRVDQDVEDNLVTAYLEAAEEYVSEYIGTDLSSLSPLPATLKAGVLLLTADLYELREAQSVNPVYQNKTLRRLLDFHVTRRRIGGVELDEE